MSLRVACAIIVVLTGSAHAQVAPTPGSVLESLPGVRRAPPPSPPEVIFPDQPRPQVHDRKGARFEVHAFDFVGNTAFPSWRLKEVIARYLDFELNLYDLNVAADAITEFYHDRGYALARAVIPPQRVVDGRVQINVVEGRIGQVLFSGNRRYGVDFLLRRVGSLAPGTLATTDRLERDLLLLNDLPGLKARATLSPGQEFGSSDVLVKLDEKPVSFSATLDNYGRKETGQARFDGGVELNNPLGIGDQLSLRAILTSERLMRYKKLGYSLPVNDDGRRLSGSISDVQYEVAGNFAALGLDGRAQTRELALHEPYLRSRGTNAAATFGLRDIELSQRAFGTEISRTRFRLLNVGNTYNRIGEDSSVTNLSMSISGNFTRNLSGLRQDAVPARIEVDLNYLEPLNRNWDIYVRANTVYSYDRLPDSEKFAVGGPGSVRAYRSSELRGDSGYQGTLEIRRQLSVASRPATASLFLDVGSVVFKFPGFADDHRSISGFGAGFTMYAAKEFTFKLEIALPGRGYKASDGGHGRLWASVSSSF